MVLAVEANGVFALRMMKLMRGGRRARREARLMVNEKIDAALEATGRLMAVLPAMKSFIDIDSMWR
jgi:hypothetical protein